MNDTLPEPIKKAITSYQRACFRFEQADTDTNGIAMDGVCASLVSAIVAYARDERERGRRDAIDWLRGNGAVIQADRLESNLGLSSAPGELEAAARALLAEWDGPPAAVADKHFDRLRAALSPAPPSPAEDDDGVECTCLAPHPACPNCNGTGKVTP